MLQPYIVGVTGGQKYSDKARVYAELDAMHMVRPITLLVVGDADGADCFARCWARDRQVSLKVYKANWAAFGRHGPDNAGYRRNQEIVDHGLSVLVAFPGHSGTADCTRRAVAAGVPVRPVNDAPTAPTTDQAGSKSG